MKGRLLFEIAFSSGCLGLSVEGVFWSMLVIEQMDFLFFKIGCLLVGRYMPNGISIEKFTCLRMAQS